jgi:hypothetical protein
MGAPQVGQVLVVAGAVMVKKLNQYVELKVVGFAALRGS